ncbi:MAG: rRNA maturation RNase YbeY [Chloroflexi bacterium]|nr:rRNA maturation RNase YbeY [Chloroflexota bacterium]
MTSPDAERWDVAVAVSDAFLDEVDGDRIAALLARLLEGEGIEDGAGLTIEIADDELLTDLNREHRGVDGPTDVLSFAAEEGEAFPGAPDQPRYLGDIAVSVETVRRNAAEAGLTTEQEIDHVLVHGVLHLLGWDHETDEDEAAMRAREESYLGPAIHAAGARHDD